MKPAALMQSLAAIVLLLACTKVQTFCAYALPAVERGIARGTASSSALRFSNSTISVATNDSVVMGEVIKRGPLRVLFLSSDTGGGHRASAEALAKQFELHFPGSTYDLVDVWTMDGVFPYKVLVPSYKHLSAHPNQWRLFYHVSNTVVNEFLSNLHSGFTCERRIRERIASYDPDVVISVHPTMNRTPIKSVKRLSKKHGKHIPFFTVVTDLGSGHSMWFQKNVEKMYIASERIRRLARRRGNTPEDRIVMAGLPIRHDFSVQAAALGDRTSEEGRMYQMDIRRELGIDPNKQMILLMGGGEGVGSLSDIVDMLYVSLARQGVQATICVVCGRNEKLKADLAVRDWSKVMSDGGVSNATATDDVSVIGLGYVTRMAEYMIAADVLVTKAGPGTIAEAASVGLPVMLTSYLPGQEAGNVDVVLDAEFGAFCKEPSKIAATVTQWLQNKEELNSMSRNGRKVGDAEAASNIVRDIGEITHSWMELNGARVSLL